MGTEYIELAESWIDITYYGDRQEFFLEAMTKGISLVGSYSVMKHPPHTTPGEYHLHVYNGLNEI